MKSIISGMLIGIAVVLLFLIVTNDVYSKSQAVYILKSKGELQIVEDAVLYVKDNTNLDPLELESLLLLSKDYYILFQQKKPTKCKIK
jgi:hypothetical protein